MSIQGKTDTIVVNPLVGNSHAGCVLDIYVCDLIDGLGKRLSGKGLGGNWITKDGVNKHFCMLISDGESIESFVKSIRNLALNIEFVNAYPNEARTIQSLKKFKETGCI